jgi:hypothetical protein
MEKIDLVKQYKTWYTAPKKPAQTIIPPAQLLAITGKGDPSGDVFTQKIAALFGVAYTVKFAQKAKGKDFAVPKLEAQWWFDINKYGIPDLHQAPQIIPRSEWEFRAMIRMPDFVGQQDINDAIELAFDKKALDETKNITLFHLDEGLCVQMLHIGPFSTEPASLSLMHTYIQEKGLLHNGLHHEIYLSDFRKSAPDKLKTILREPVR